MARRLTVLCGLILCGMLPATGWAETTLEADASPVTERAVELGAAGWKIRARKLEIRASSRQLLARDVVASRGGWWLTAEQLEIMSGDRALIARARGRIRILGPQSLHVIGPYVELDHDTLVLKRTDHRPSFVGRGYSLHADVIHVKIESDAVRLERIARRD